MPAPVSVAHTHVHSMRLATGEEALVARVLTLDGVAGFGFTLNLEAVVAREMAGWDAAARARAVPLHALLGGKTRAQVRIVAPGGNTLDPFGGQPLEEVRSRAEGLQSVVLIAPHAHRWELSYCAALAASLPGDVRIAASETTASFIAVPDVPGIGIDWSAEPGFESLRWISP
jgi:L-alanine-DL-glutamate epimerase-like enolase superfamily enzyme